MIKNKEELFGELCDYCPHTGYGKYPISDTPWKLCEGTSCDYAYCNYLNTHGGNTNGKK